jgi:hypothetical protein
MVGMLKKTHAQGLHPVVVKRAMNVVVIKRV